MFQADQMLTVISTNTLQKARFWYSMDNVNIIKVIQNFDNICLPSSLNVLSFSHLATPKCNQVSKIENQLSKIEKLNMEFFSHLLLPSLFRKLFCLWAYNGLETDFLLLKLTWWLPLSMTRPITIDFKADGCHCDLSPFLAIVKVQYLWDVNTMISVKYR